MILRIIRACAWALTASLLLPIVAGAQSLVPSTTPVAAIPPGAYLEGDILKWINPPEGADCTNCTYWPSGIVPYIFSSNVNATNQGRALAAFTQIENVSAVNFRPFQAGDTNWLFIQNSTVNSSFVGRQSGSQVVNMVSWSTQMVIIHELFHALGFYHEQSRQDRGGFVVINFGNIQPGAVNNFNIASTLDYSPYDFDSIMHYRRNAFTVNGFDTITVLAARNNVPVPFASKPIGPNGQCFTNPPPTGGWQVGIGNRTHMSHWDCRMVSFRYPESDWRWVSSTRANGLFQFGTFLLPWDTIAEAIAGTPNNGDVWIYTGTYAAPTTISKQMTIRAPLGSVTLN